jgi:hypothetical protein
MSVFTYPERGPWGDAKWRGNMTGHMYQEIFQQYQPKTFVDPMMGSGTSIEVAVEMGIEAFGLDLHAGFNILSDSILAKVGKPVDMVLSHPPYGQLVNYQTVHGVDHLDDLSRCGNGEEFHQKMQIAMLNQREATKIDGIYGCIIGDYRVKGEGYQSYQAEIITRMPKELVSILIKQQSNVTSDFKTYARLRHHRIQHEYVLLFCKKGGTTYHLLGQIAHAQALRLKGTWRAIVRTVMIHLGGKATLADMYQHVSTGCPDQIKTNENWQAKVRQVLNSTGEYISVGRGTWKFA